MADRSKRNGSVARDGGQSWTIHGQRLPWVVLALLMGVATAAADVKLPALIGDNMVLQQGRQVAIWGTADAGEQVTVSLGKQKKTAAAGADGQWNVKLGPLKKGGPLEMVVAGRNTITIHNVLMGEVWVCSGQTNMDGTLLGRGRSGGVMNAEQEDAAANYPLLRLFVVKKAVAGKPQTDVQGQWVVATPETVGNFSAVGYFFGRDLHQAMKFPVGLIGSSYFDTEGEAWTGDAVLQADPALKVVADSWQQKIAEFPHVLEQFEQKLGDPQKVMELQEWEKAAEEAEANGKVASAIPDKLALAIPNVPKDPRSSRRRDAAVWNAMVAPLTSYAIAGVIWYQGESNAEFPYQYRKLFPAMIQQWRSSWGEGDFPFLFVQLTNYSRGFRFPDVWPTTRESQATALALPKTGMAVAMDIGDHQSMFPKNKQEVGRRLALAAEGIAYGRKIEYQGPTFKSMRVDNGTVRLQFTHVAGGLVVHGESLKGFVVAGEDQKVFPAEAQIEGTEVVLSSPQVAKPVAVRYAWANDPVCTLYNKAGLPAPQFRTDDWTVSLQTLVRTVASW
ncbi:MAG: sialate O-acetylesterase [Terriglobia bacterium]